MAMFLHGELMVIVFFQNEEQTYRRSNVGPIAWKQGVEPSTGCLLEAYM
jgi:hypothetical protein